MFKKLIKFIKNPFFYFDLYARVIYGIFLSKKHISDFELLQGVGIGKRCFILGNGPSIQNYDLSKLENEDTFVTNRGYFLGDLGLKNINYYVLSDKHLYPHDKANIDTFLRKVRYNFFSQIAKRKYEEKDIIFRYRNILFWEQMSKKFSIFHPKKGMSEGGTVVLDCLNIADYLGYEEIIFLGIDMNYQKGKEHFYAVTKKEEKQSSIDFKNVSNAFNNARINLKKRGKKVYNATKESKLQSIEFISYDSLF